MPISVYPSTTQLASDSGAINIDKSGNVLALEVSDPQVRNKLEEVLAYLKAMHLGIQEIVGDSLE
jgi:hypothetical protein